MPVYREIWVIDDHQLFSAGMKRLLESVAEHHQIKCFNHPKDATPEARAIVSLIIMDLYIPGVDTVTWIGELVTVYPATPLVVISSSTSMTDKENCIKAGAAAYYPKHAPPEQTLERLVRFIERKTCGEDFELDLVPCRHDLTVRQVEILIQVARGHSNKKVAKLLNVSPETVKSHLAAIYKIILCVTRDEAVEWARAKGLL